MAERRKSKVLEKGSALKDGESERPKRGGLCSAWMVTRVFSFWTKTEKPKQRAIWNTP